MWIESVLGHSFLACNLLSPRSLIKTSDTEWSGIHWSRKVSYSKSQVSHWSGEKQRRWRDTTRPDRDLHPPARAFGATSERDRRFALPTRSETRFPRIYALWWEGFSLYQVQPVPFQAINQAHSCCSQKYSWVHKRHREDKRICGGRPYCA